MLRHRLVSGIHMFNPINTNNMKKFFLTLLVAIATVSAGAQTYVGGGVGFWRNADDNHTNFNLKPEVGYNLSDKWAVGIGIGYDYNYKNDVKDHKFSVDPYARWSFVKFGPVGLFLDMGFGIGTHKTKVGDADASDADVTWQIGVAPGVKVSLCKNLDFIAHCGFFGYRDNDSEIMSYGEKGFGLKFSGNDLNFGLRYNF